MSITQNNGSNHFWLNCDYLKIITIYPLQPCSIIISTSGLQFINSHTDLWYWSLEISTHFPILQNSNIKVKKCALHIQYNQVQNGPKRQKEEIPIDDEASAIVSLVGTLAVAVTPTSSDIGSNAFLPEKVTHFFLLSPYSHFTLST